MENMAAEQMNDNDDGSAGTTCPACGHETDVEREPYPGLGDFALTELETMARNRWRKRLGPEAYARDHPTEFVRSVIVYALNPESPVRGEILEFRLWSVVAAMEVWGLSRAGIRHDLTQLVLAVRDTLEPSRLPPDTVDVFSRSMADKLSAVLGWPGAVDHSEPAPLAVGGAPIHTWEPDDDDSERNHR